MEIRNENDKHKVVVVKVGQDDVEGMLINHDLRDDGFYTYMEKEFIDAVMNYLPEYAMGEEPLPASPLELVPYMRETAKSVIKIKKIEEIRKYIDDDVPYEDWDKGILDIYAKKGVFSELILHFLLRTIKGTTPLISKIYFKDSFSHEAHGFDSVHVSDDRKLWLGETKFYSDGKSGVKALIEDLKTHFKHDYLKDQFVIISRALVHKNPEREEWINTLNNAKRLEEKFDMVVVPMLCIYEDGIATEIMSAINRGTDADTIFFNHVSELKGYFDKNNDFANKERVQTLLLLLPVECKKRIVSEMLSRICNMQNI